MMCQKSKICISNAWVCDGDLGMSWSLLDKVIIENKISLFIKIVPMARMRIVA